MLLLEEGLLGSVTYRNYRAPGTRSAWRRVGVMAAVALTERRLLVRGRGGPLVDVAWAQHEAHALEPSVDKGRLLIAFDAAAFHPDRSGRVEVRLRSANPEQVVALIGDRR